MRPKLEKSRDAPVSVSGLCPPALWPSGHETSEPSLRLYSKPKPRQIKFRTSPPKSHSLASSAFCWPSQVTRTDPGSRGAGA